MKARYFYFFVARRDAIGEFAKKAPKGLGSMKKVH